MKWPFKRREDSLTVILHEALRKKYYDKKTSGMEEMALLLYFPDGFAFMSEAEYRRRLAEGNFRDVRGGIVSVTDGHVNIHTKVTTKQT